MTAQEQPPLQRLRWKAAWRGFAKGELIRFRPGVNLVVGDQGTGKSTLLNAIRAKSDAVQPGDIRTTVEVISAGEHCSVWTTKTRPIKVMQFDFERDNPRVKSWSSAIAIDGNLNAAGNIMWSRARSHGEFVLKMLGELPAKAAEAKRTKTALLIVLDEPDTGLSGRSALKIANVFANTVAAGIITTKTRETSIVQIIAAVHNPWLIEAFRDRDVLSLEHRRWLRADDFLARWKYPRIEGRARF